MINREAGVRVTQIYDSEASYSYAMREETNPDWNDVHPHWCIHLHEPWRVVDGVTATGDATFGIPHARLEHMCSWGGFDADELPAIVDTVLHLRIPSLDNPLAWDDPGQAAAMNAVRDMPDPADPRLPYEVRREILLAHAAAAKQHIVAYEPAALDDRAGALAARAYAIHDAAAQWEAAGYQLPAHFWLGIDDQAPDHPLDPILGLARLDPARIAVRRRRDEYRRLRGDRTADGGLVAHAGPDIFQAARRMPPPPPEPRGAARARRPAPSTLEVRRP